MEYLAIDGWAEFQPLRGKGSWIKDATDQGVKPKLSGLSIFTDGVLQRLRRLRGRTGKNIPYDIGYISRSIHAEATDRPHLRHAIDTLIARGVLVVTNQEVDILKAGEKEKEIEKEIEKEKKPSAKAAPRGSLEPKDPRFPHCVEILHRYWDKFAKPTISFELWFGKAGGRQLKNSLNRHDKMQVEEFTRFVANRARSPGVNHCQPAYEWVGHILDWAGGPVNGGGNSKAERRVAHMAETTRAVFGGGGDVLGNSANGLPDATSNARASDLEGNAKRLLPRGIP